MNALEKLKQKKLLKQMEKAKNKDLSDKGSKALTAAQEVINCTANLISRKNGFSEEYTKGAMNNYPRLLDSAYIAVENKDILTVTKAEMREQNLNVMDAKNRYLGILYIPEKDQQTIYVDQDSENPKNSSRISKYIAHYHFTRNSHYIRIFFEVEKLNITSSTEILSQESDKKIEVMNQMWMSSPYSFKLPNSFLTSFLNDEHFEVELIETEENSTIPDENELTDQLYKFIHILSLVLYRIKIQPDNWYRLTSNKVVKNFRLNKIVDVEVPINVLQYSLEPINRINTASTFHDDYFRKSNVLKEQIRNQKNNKKKKMRR